MAELVYLLYFALMLFARGIGLVEGGALYSASIVAGMLLFGLKVLATEHSLMEIAWMAALLALSAAVYASSGEKGLLFYMTMALGIKGVRTERAFTAGLIAWGSAFLALTVLSLAGVVNEAYTVHNKYRVLYIGRHTFGYPHPNVLHMSYLVLAAFVIWLAAQRGRRALRIWSAVMMAGNAYIFLYSVSMTGVIITALYIALALWLAERSAAAEAAGEGPYPGKKHRAAGIAMTLLQPACAVFILGVPLLIHGTRAYAVLDRVFNRRIGYTYEYLTRFPMPLFGVSSWVEAETGHATDSAYLYAWVHLGVIAFAVLMVLTFLTVRDCARRGDTAALAMLLSFAVCGVAEQFLYNIGYKNITFLFIGEYLFRRSAAAEAALTGRARAVLGRRIRILRLPEHVPAAERAFAALSSAADRIGRAFAGCSRRTAALFAAAALAGVILCAAFGPAPGTVYEDPAGIRNHDYGQEQVFLDEAGVREARARGDLVFAYHGPDVPLWPYEGSVPAIERLRQLVTAGAAGLIAAAAVRTGLGLRRGSSGAGADILEGKDSGSGPGPQRAEEADA